jgi:transposase-like protein|tara:strand:- start:381 stop:755 length:375 start_codon:yes stop_codon:yes gene_type:complete
MNAPNCLPKRSQAKAAIKEDAVKATDLFTKTHDPKDPDAPLCLQKDREELTAFFDVPAPHCQSIRTRNPVEAAFTAIRHRTKRGLSRYGMLLMLAQCDEQNGRRLRGLDCLAKGPQTPDLPTTR